MHSNLVTIRREARKIALNLIGILVASMKVSWEQNRKLVRVTLLEMPEALIANLFKIRWSKDNKEKGENSISKMLLRYKVAAFSRTPYSKKQLTYLVNKTWLKIRGLKVDLEARSEEIKLEAFHTIWAKKMAFTTIPCFSSLLIKDKWEVRLSNLPVVQKP